MAAERACCDGEPKPCFVLYDLDFAVSRIVTGARKLVRK